MKDSLVAILCLAFLEQAFWGLSFHVERYQLTELVKGYCLSKPLEKNEN